MQEPNKPCRTAHVFNGKVPTINDTHLKGLVCDCTKFVLDIKGCSCSGSSKKVVLKPNTHYAAKSK